MFGWLEFVREEEGGSSKPNTKTKSTEQQSFSSLQKLCRESSVVRSLILSLPIWPKLWREGWPVACPELWP